MRKLALALLLLLFSAVSTAQQPVFCPTRPLGDNTNACASTAFVLANGGSGTNILPLNNVFTGTNNFTLNTEMGANIAPDSLLTINANTAASSQLIGSNTSVHMIGADNITNSFRYDSFGATNSIAAIRYDGINASRQGLVAGDNILAINAFGYDTSTLANSEIIRFFAGETWSPTAHGGYISVLTTPLTTASAVEMARFQPTGGLSVGNANVATDPGNGNIRATGLTLAGITGGTAQCLHVNTVGLVSGTGSDCGSGGGGGTPGGSSTQVQFNSAGTFGGITGATSNGTNLTVSSTLNVSGTFQFNGNTMTFPAAAATLAQTIASGQLALSTTAIASAACSSAQTATATGTVSTDAIIATFGADPTAVTGYIPSTSGMLTIFAYPTTNTVNFKVCNNTSASITPGSVTINWRVSR